MELKLFCLTIFSALFLSGCGEFKKALDFQEEYAREFSVSGSTVLVLDKQHNPKVIRGINPTEYSAVIPKGKYVPIAASAGRVFYQAPDGFEQKKRDTVQSRVGGIVQAKAGNDNEFYVWVFGEEKSYFEIQPNGVWVKDVKPGYLNILSRPWVENDLVVKW